MQPVETSMGIVVVFKMVFGLSVLVSLWYTIIRYGRPKSRFHLICRPISFKRYGKTATFILKPVETSAGIVVVTKTVFGLSELIRCGLP
jgi:hypothetical protein